jgi:hypothetical protein
MKYAMLAAMAAVLAPIAYAQDCTPLNTVITSGVEEGFESVAGDEIDDGIFDGKIAFFDADECGVDAILGQYYCLWARPTVAEADAAIAPLYDMAKVCLSGGWDWVDMAGGKTGAEVTITEGYQMTRTTGATKGAVVRVYMEGNPAEPWRQVWLEVE